MGTTLRRDAGVLSVGNRRATFRLVTPAVDRHGTVIEPQGIVLDSHKAAGSPFLWMHQSGEGFSGAPDPDVVIGRVVEYLQSPQALDIVVEFDSDGPQGLASRCWAKVQSGLLRSVSIGCSVIESETRTVAGQSVPVYTRTELVEASLVIIGSNREALRLDRAAALRELSNMETKMDMQALCKMLGIEESATREEAEKACMDYLVKTDDGEARKSAAAALDEHFPESAAGEDKSRADASQTEVEELRAANQMLTKALDEAKQGQGKAESDAKEATERAVKREAKIVADVDGWISEGRVQRAARDEYIAKHRQGKAAGIVRHIPAGAFTTGQRLSGGAVGSPVTDLPAKPETAVRSIAREVVARARNMDRSGAVAPAAQQSDVNPVRSDAKRIVERARNLRG